MNNGCPTGVTPSPVHPEVARAPHWSAQCLVLSVLLVSLSGCGGCRSRQQATTNPTEEEKKKAEEEKEKEKEKPDFETGRIAVLPNQEALLKNGVKPGHWLTAVQTMKANKDRFIGELQTTCLDQAGRMVPLPQSSYRVETVRPLTLPKGQTKELELLYYVPRGSRGLMLQSTLATRGGRPILRPAEPTVRLKQHQYLFAVLSSLPDAYGYLKELASITPPRDELSFYDLDSDYLVMLPVPSQRAPLPSNPLTWTSIAFVVWDDYDPQVLTGSQQRAMIDWLHWGGQLIISGPRTLDGLRGSFLEEYLPAKAGRPRKISRAVVDQLSDHWYIDETIAGESEASPQEDSRRKPEVIALEKHEEADFVPRTGRLLVERRVGRGRIVASAFWLADGQFTRQKRFDEFFNTCILRRPPREFESGPNGMLDMSWRGADGVAVQREARYVCSLRYFSRDVTDSMAAPSRVTSGYDSSAMFPTDGFQSDAQSGVAGWSDLSGVAEACRKSLVQAAGISVPSSSFVFRILSAYLFCLVPLNWVFFKMIGRIDWAWVAAPVIAIAGAIVVVRLAQLDIGFVRSRTEIAVVETQGDHPRAHVARYSAMYTSLSTRYRLQFDDDSALSLPLSSKANRGVARHDTVTFRRDHGSQLGGLRVLSNSTGMVHSEQMFALDGPIRLSSAPARLQQVANDSKFNLRGVGVIRRTERDTIEYAIVNDLRSKTTALLSYQTAAPGLEAIRHMWEESLTSAQTVPQGVVGLRELLEGALDPQRLHPGDVRLVGWCEEEVRGLSIEPRASQKTFRTVLVANLRYGKLLPPQGDDPDRRLPEIKEALEQGETYRERTF